MYVLKFVTIMNEDRHFAMKRTSALFLIFISVVCSYTLESADFHFINVKKSYEQAKTYCREMYTDLATVHNLIDMDRLITLVSTAAERAWIGLESGDMGMWHWSLSDQNTDFFNWKTGEPQTNNVEGCAAMDLNGKWFESDCETQRNFLCHGHASSYKFFVEAKSWRDAQHHCRKLSFELVSIHSEDENAAVRNLSGSQTVWIGLFKDPWKWSDGGISSFRFWKPRQPHYSKNQKCVAAVFKDQGMWNNRNCNLDFNFICQSPQKSIPATTSSQTTKESITADELPKNLTTLSQNSSEGVTVSFTVADTKQPNLTSVTTPAPPNGSATTNTKESESHPSYTELDNATAKMSTRLSPITTVNTIGGSVSALTTQKGTSAQRPTQSSSLMTTISSPSQHSEENLILIQKNKTWIAAMSYCREHFIDLVYITSKEIQDKVAVKVKNATSAHVWLGLRYTCAFKFWFWTGSASSCYQNWMAGQGPEGVHECGTSGAIKTTGWQQWVGLPETEELNFICSACGG